MSENILNVDKLNKQYGDFSLNDVSFGLNKGCITGFIGQNGAGKTTTLSALMRLINPDSGKVEFDGHAVRGTGDLMGISYLESNRDLYPEVKMEEYKYFVSHAFKRTWNENKYREYMKRFKVDKDTQIKNLSTGMKEKFFLAVELAKQPKLLIMDEPTSGLDPLARNEFLKILRDLVNKEGLTVFFSSHITSDIEHIADNVIFIHNGKILLDMDNNEINSSFKRVDHDSYEKMPADKKKEIKESGIRNFDYYVVDTRKVKLEAGSSMENAGLDDVLTYLTGGEKVA